MGEAEKVVRYRAEAERLRQLIKNTSDPDSRRVLCIIAETYDKFAKQEEKPGG